MRVIGRSVILLLLLAPVSGWAEDDLDPPLPCVPVDWSSDPLFRPADHVITSLGQETWCLGPLTMAGKSHEVVLQRRDQGWTAQVRVAQTRGTGHSLAVQRLFRRLIIGPIGPAERGEPIDPAGNQAWVWLLIRDGRLALVEHRGQVRYYEDEAQFDVVFDRIQLAHLDERQRRAWLDAFWRRENDLIAQERTRSARIRAERERKAGTAGGPAGP